MGKKTYTIEAVPSESCHGIAVKVDGEIDPAFNADEWTIIWMGSCYNFEAKILDENGSTVDACQQNCHIGFDVAERGRQVLLIGPQIATRNGE